ncbi:hypothetical protein KDAU_58220 [Dictyobacter aurantiacus]|uniref:Uncharacterized protein n=1 Tax=Dictyobacter aurantiacus TaxID=1936993 RepID=A0A401ZNQ7_9CHLR|nr:hypothetical protein KDAU_58220 [Dictyobacter aurantiacus]
MVAWGRECAPTQPHKKTPGYSDWVAGVSECFYGLFSQIDIGPVTEVESVAVHGNTMDFGRDDSRR